MTKSRPGRCLFFPSYRGGGFGHVGRCLALAEELTERGWEVAFVLGGPHVDRLLRAGWKVFCPRPSLPLTRLRRWLGAVPGWFRPSPAYLFFSDLNFQVVRDGFHTSEIVEQEIAWELDVVGHFCPDLLVGDGWLLTSIVGRLAGLPVVQLVRSSAHPACPRLVWWRAPPSQICSPDVTSVFNPILKQWGLPAIRRAEDLLDGDLLLVPSVPELDPLPSGVERTHYVGPLVRSVEDGESMLDWLTALPRERPVVYVTVGGGSDSVRRLNLLPLWKAAFSETDWVVVISTGGRPVPLRWRRVENLQVFPWVPGGAVIDRADVVLFHGGYGTMMETVRAGVPSVILPFHTEQECNGRRLQQSGAAQVLAPQVEDLEPVEGRWGGGEFSTLVARGFIFQADQIREAVLSVLRNDCYHTAALYLQQSQAAYSGATLAVEALKSLSDF